MFIWMKWNLYLDCFTFAATDMTPSTWWTGLFQRLVSSLQVEYWDISINASLHWRILLQGQARTEICLPSENRPQGTLWIRILEAHDSEYTYAGYTWESEIIRGCISFRKNTCAHLSRELISCAFSANTLLRRVEFGIWYSEGWLKNHRFWSNSTDFEWMIWVESGVKMKINMKPPTHCHI